MKAYIWDLDGTLLDSYAVIVSSLCDTLREFGKTPDTAVVSAEVIRTSTTACIEKMCPEVSLETVFARYRAVSAARNETIGLIAGAAETLKALSARGDRHFVVTHRGTSATAVLKRCGIFELFTEIITAADGFPRKPAPDAVRYLMQKHRLAAAGTFYVGDRTLDMDCAKNAGIGGILYLPPGSFCVPNGNETLTVTDLADIPDL